jgi:hypothetical protein
VVIVGVIVILVVVAHSKSLRVFYVIEFRVTIKLVGCTTLIRVITFSYSLQKRMLRIMYVEGKAAPLQAWTGPEGSRSLRTPDFLTISA